MQRLLYTFFVAVLLSGCIIDTVPMPDVTAPEDLVSGSPDANAGDYRETINGDAVYYAEVDAMTAYIVGAPGAMPGAGTVVCRNTARDSVESIVSQSNGSFVRSIFAAVGDTIELFFVRDDTVIAYHSVTLIAGTAGAMAATDTLEDAQAFGGATAIAAIVVSPPSGGSVNISGATAAAGSGIYIVAGNLSANYGVSGAVAADGSFSVNLPGSSGDILQLFAVEPAFSNGSSSPPVMLTVP